MSEIERSAGTIRKLPDRLVNQIAAGEVIERPASAVKELVENSLDAGADRISVAIRDGGRALIAVTDNGGGMTPEEMQLAVERHATSKLPDDDLTFISTLGFRGEALPSIGSVSRLSIESRPPGADTTQRLEVEGGKLNAPRPVAGSEGTRIEVRDLFYATPARLKFLRSPRAESSAVAEVLNRLAMAHPGVSFSLEDEGRQKFSYSAAQGELLGRRLDRLGQIMGREFRDNALAVNAEREDFRLTGYAGVPTLNRGNAAMQFLFVNGRPVRDKQLVGAVRAAYQDFLARDRHPMLALFLECEPRAVDVNVHPAKAEVRFREPGTMRGLIVGALKHALAEAGHKASTTVSAAALGAMRPDGQYGTGLPSGAARQAPLYAYRPDMPQRPSTGLSAAAYAFQGPDGVAAPAYPDSSGAGFAPAARAEQPPGADEETLGFPLGAARAQLHATYVVAQTEDGIVIVDQHAAHERLVLERMKRQMAEGSVARQGLLLPEIV